MRLGIGPRPAGSARRVAFTGYAPGTPFAAGTLPGGGSYVQAAGSGQSEETFVTSWAAGTLSRLSFVADTPKVGQAPNGVAGLRLRASWTNYCQTSEDFSSWSITGTSVVGSNAATAPDGTLTADTLTDDDGATYELVGKLSLPGVPNDSAVYSFQAFVGKTVGQTHALAANWSLSGGTLVSQNSRLDSNTGTVRNNAAQACGVVTFGSSWLWWWDRVANNSTGNIFANVQLYPAAMTLPLPGVDTAAGTGAKTAWGVQMSRGKLFRDYQPAAGAAATCADSAAVWPASRFVSAGRIRILVDFTPTGAPTDYDVNARLFDKSDETTYLEFSATDQKLRIVVAGGAAEVCAVPMWWPSSALLTSAHPRVQLVCETGGGLPSRIRYRYSTDGGVTWSLPFDPMGGAAGVSQGNIGSGGHLGILTGASAGTVFDGWLHDRQYVTAAPAWALQALPTDVASVKAFFRADGGYVLSAGLVSSWSGQTATAVTPFTQAVSSNQPTFAASGLGAARPSFTFDGANDYLEAGALSEWLTRGAVYILFRCAVVNTNNAPNYNNRPLWENVGAYAGVALRTGPTAGGFNYDGSYDDASVGFALSTAQVVRWRHDVSNIYMRVGSSGESAPTASGATLLLTGNNRIGGNPGTVGVYYQGEIAAVVAMNTDPTAQEDAAIMAYLNAYGSL